MRGTRENMDGGVCRSIPQEGKRWLSKTKCRVFIDYFGIIQNIEKQCGGIFIDDIYMKINYSV